MLLCNAAEDDEALARELQQAEEAHARMHGPAAATSAPHQQPPTASVPHSDARATSLTGLAAPPTAGPTCTSSSSNAAAQPAQRPSNNPFAPSKRMPWDRTSPPASGLSPQPSNAPSSDPFAALPPLYAQPSGPPAGPAPMPLYQQPGDGGASFGTAWQPQAPQQHQMWSQPARAGPPQQLVRMQQQQQPGTAGDEALARSLQQQLDLQQGQGAARQASTAGSAARAQQAADEAYARALQQQLDAQAAAPPGAGQPGSRPQHRPPPQQQQGQQAPPGRPGFFQPLAHGGEASGTMSCFRTGHARPCASGRRDPNEAQELQY